MVITLTGRDIGRKTEGRLAERTTDRGVPSSAISPLRRAVMVQLAVYLPFRSTRATLSRARSSQSSSGRIESVDL